MKRALFCLLCGVLYVAAANRIQVWTQENVSYDIGLRTTAAISQENRIGINDADGNKHIDEIHVAPSIDYKLFTWMNIGVNYRHVLLRDGSDTRYKQDRRPGIDVAFHKSISRFTLLNRSRFICRIPEGENPYFRYRNLSKLSYSIGKISPFVSYEWYYDEGSKDREYRKNDRFSQQWISAGVDWKFSRYAKASLYYMLTENKDRMEYDWYPGHVIGVGVSLSF